MEAPDRIELPTDRPRPALRHPAWQRIAGRVPAGATADPFAAFAVFVGKIANAKELVIGRPDGDGVGLVVVELDPQQPFGELAEALRDRAPVPVGALANIADPARHPTCDVGFGAGEPLGDLHVRVRVDVGEYELLYDASLFSAERARRLARCYVQVLRATRDTPVGKISVLTELEAAELLDELSTPIFNWPKHFTLHEMFESRADQAPDAIALAYGEVRVTYGELEARANAVAADLARRGVGADAIVALLLDRSSEMIVAMLGVLKAGAAYLPIDPDAPPDRVAYLLEDSGARAVIASRPVDHPYVIHADDVLPPAPREPRRAEPHHLAYVIYTSGSTGLPKGVLVEHRNVVHLIFAEKEDLAIRASDALILLSSYTFDASIDQIWLALTSGAKLVLVDKSTLIDPEALAGVIAAEGVTHLDTVPALLAELPRDLPSVRQIVVGGEACPVAIARAWSRSTRFWNEYGPTETTVGSLRHRVDPAIELGDRVPIGRPIGMTRVYVLDWGGCPAPIGVRGELCIGGAGVARGYLHRDALTRERFVADPFAEPGAKMYRSGDLVAWLPDGSLEFFGRLDSQVKVRGFRIELGEIEAALLQHGDVTGAAASVFGGDRLVAHVVANRELAATELRAHLAQTLPAYMIPDFFVQLDAFPRTVSGKIDRKALPAPTLADGVVEPAANQVEAQLVAIWSRVLAVPVEQIGVTRSFFELGGHSLLVMTLLARIKDALGVALPAQAVLANPTIRAIAAAVASAAGQVMPRAAAGDALPATSVQRRMYVIQQGNPRSTSYNLPLLYEVGGAVDADAIGRACAQLVERHESLRTAFFFQAGEILQKIAAPKFELERIELASIDDLGAATTAFVRPFRLEAPPLFRAAVLVHAGRVAYLALDMHHIIADGTSIDVLLEDLMALLAGGSPTAPALRYLDYASWVRSAAGAAQLAAGKAYWTALLHEDLPVLELPYDFRRPLSRQQAAGELTLELPQGLLDTIAAFARAREATPFAVYCAAYALLLSCLTGSSDVVFGYPSAGRPHPDFERTVGMFVNSLPFRARIDEDDTFDDLVRQAMIQIRRSVAAEDYPFEDMVADLQLPPTPGRNPIFDTMLSYEGAMPELYRSGEATLREVRLAQRHARMDLVATIREHAGAGASVRLEYSADLFKRTTIERIGRDLVSILERVLAGAVKVADVEIVDEAEREQLLHGFNATAHVLPGVRAVHALFEQHVDAEPDAIAVEMGAVAWSYGEVERRANALAHLLRGKGLGRDALVAIQLEPCPEMLVAVLGVLKAGAAFLPIDPEYPIARKQHMLRDSNARVVLTRGELSADVAAGLDIVDLARPIAGKTDRLDVDVERGDLAYVIYTSGSTGLPKGTLIEHGGLLNFATWYADYFAIRAGDGVSKYAGFGFDASISEIVPCFISGARLVIVPAELRLAVEELDAYFADHRVAITFLPTQFGEQFLRVATRHQLRAAFLGGEKLRQRPSDRTMIVNGYGPTEYTVAATAFTVDKAYDNIPIGKPLWNTQILILDRLDRLCPIGVAGELCISGASTARGYLNRPELTAEKFVAHPFDPSRRMYRTGDLARWLDDGNLEFLGRIDTQVKVRGFRVELGEIEQALLALPAIAAAVVVARDNPAVAGDLSLIGFVTARAFDEAELKAALARTLPAYMVPARIVEVPEIPLTANGKVDKRKLPDVALEEVEIIPPRDAAETQLRELYADVLGRPAATISIHASFLELGGHSLKAAVLLSALYQKRGVQVRFAQFLAASSVSELAALIASEQRGAGPSWDRAPEGPLRPTSSQLRIYAVHQLSSWSTAYNIPFAWELAPELDLDRLARALAALVPRHHALRARFVERAGEVIQDFTDCTLEVARIEVEDASLRATLERFTRPFDLAVAPLVRAAIITTPARRVLALDVHHIVADGLSVRLLLEDLEALYQGSAEPLTGPTFADYAHWEAGEGGAAQRALERTWWLERFSELPSPLELPVDFDRPPRLSFDGDEVALDLPAETGTPLVELAKARNITPLGVFLGAYAVILSRLGNTPDVVIGVPAAGRQRAGMERMVGMFVNTVPLRIRLRADEPFSELCVRIGREATEAFERQTYQLNDLVADLGLARDPSRNPLFDVLFAWEEAELVEMTGSSLGLVELPQAQAASKFDLELTVQNTAAGQKLTLLFARKLFKKATAERFLGNLRKLLEQIARSPDAKVRELRMLQPWERELLLAEFNDTAVAVPPVTMPELFARHVRDRPEAIAVEDAHGTYTFAELDRRASALAAELIARGVVPDDVVAIVMARSRELLVAMIGIWKAGAGYLPIETDAPAERVAVIVEDSRARLVLSQNGDYGLANAVAWDAIDFTARVDVAARATPRTVAYVIYTSGSTGKPKGVVIEHRNVVSFLVTSVAELGVTPEDRVLLFSSFTFDASIEQLGLALVAGARLVIPTKDVLLDHDAFEAFVHRTGVTHLDTVPLFLSGFTPKQALPFKRVIVGGDICPLPVAQRWAPAQPFYNEYGPTETTITSLRHEVSAEDFAESRIPVGRPIANTQIYILDWTGQLAPLGVPGEMYIGGAGVARGYLNNEALTRERFVANPYVPGERMYKTGDIARWLPEGMVDFLGRADNQIKIRGFRIELGEIEAALLRHPAVAEAAVIARDHGGDKRLVGYAVLRGEVAANALRSFLARSLPSYMVPDAIVVLDALPVTTSGKIDRKRLPEPVFEAAGADDAPATLAEEKLIEIWAEVLKLQPHQIPVERSFFELGGHSLLIMMVIARIQQAFTVRLTAADVFDAPTVRGLARLIEQHDREAIIPIPRVGERDHYPLSSVQRRLFAIHQLTPVSVQYNMPTVFAVEGKVTPERLEEVVRGLIARHASLRTSFHIVDGEPVQRIHATAPFALRVIDSDAELDELMQRLMQPFDLAQAPLWRVWLVRRTSGEELLVVDLHHIIADGYATGILWREVSELIRGVSLPLPRITCGDYAVWQRGEEHGRDLAAQREMWLKQFATLPAPLELPYDFRHPAVRSHAGELVVASLPKAELARLVEISRAHDSTLFATLLASWFVFLSRIGGTDDVVCGVPVAGRTHPDLHDVVGMFVNTVAWRTQVPQTGTFEDFLAATRATSLDVLASEDYQLEDLLAELDVRPLPGRNPLFDVMFVFETKELEVIDAQRVKLHFREFAHRTAKMDLTLIATESEAGLELAFEYASELFERATIERLAHHFTMLLRDIIASPGKPIGELALLDDTDRFELVETSNATVHALPEVASVLELFDHHVQAMPNAPCVVFRDTTWSYAEVDRRASAIAAWLAGHDIGREQVVALVLDPCAEMLPAILGVWRAGAAFLPVDHEYPPGRKQYLIDDSRARAVIARGELAAGIALPTLDVERVPAGSAPRRAIHERDAAYVIYTSGSTGKPKGVVIEHRSLLNFACWYADYYGLQVGEAVSKYAGFSFDASISELVPTFVAGGTLVVVPAELRLQPDELATYLESHEVRCAFLPTQFGEQFMRTTAAASLRIVTLAGEKLRAYRPVTWTIVNGYGPTEYTVCTTAFVVDRSYDNIPIGKPVWNTQVLVLDRAGRLCPIGIAGELCVAGEGIARGYLNRPELTAEKFVAHPFTPGARMYRTGDLVRWRSDGNLEYLGRIDSQVKVRGFRIELGEIEQTLLDVPGISDATVIDIADGNGATELAAYVVGEADPEALRAALARHLPEYMIPAYWTRLAALPLTPNGKVDRRALPPVERSSAKAVVAPANDPERALVAIWASVLARDPEAIGVTATFVELGGHSLKAIALVSAIYKQFQIQLRVSDVFRHPTIRAQAERLARLRGETLLGAIEPAPVAESALASSVQARMFVVAQMDPGTTYNVPGLFAVANGITRDDVAAALAALVARYDAFRSQFFLDGAEVRVRVRTDVELALPEVATTETEREAAAQALVQPFDLGAAPLARAAWLTTEQGAYLFFDMHHIVTDGVAMGILVEELEVLLAGRALGPAPAALLDCTVWERSPRAVDEIAKQRAYWQAAFPDGVPALQLVTDLPRPPVIAPEGETRFRALPAATAEALRELGQRHGLSLHALMLAAVDVFLARLARQDDIAVGTVVSGRWHPDLQRVFGMFVNTLVLTAKVDAKQSFLELARGVAQTTLEALDNQAFPFGDLVELVGDARHAGHTPLVDVMFAMQNADDRFEGDGLLRPLAVDSTTAKFDLSFVVDESRAGIQLAIEYRTSLFHRATIDRYLACLERLLVDIAERPEAAIETLVMLTDADRELVHVTWNATDVVYPPVVAAHHMFERAAAHAPHARALVAGDRVVTYGEVEAQANALAHKLRALGIARDGVVAILSPPSCELIIAELAALKAGGAFLPLDHRYPRERLEHMLRDSAARTLLVAPGFGADLDWAGPRHVLDAALFSGPITRLSVASQPNDLAYIIYTSGSTGKPKGVAIEHAQLVPFVQRTIDVYGLTAADRHSKYAGIGFDVSIIETFPPLCCGGELHIVPDELRLALPELAVWLDRSGITMMDLPTQLAEELMKQAPQTKLRWMTVGGDRLRRFYPVSFALANEYGPTEATVSATTFVVDQQYDNIPIGKPNANTKVFIIDGAGQLCPPGFAGELCIAGRGLARGYLGAPELTAKKFVHSELAGGRMYRSGDLARWLADGNIEFLGRIDSQVKIRGFRIELGEIEQALLEVEGIAAAVVIDRDDPAGDKILVAYFVGPDTSEPALRAHLAARLPDYMMPSAFVPVPAIPFTTSGKVDRRRLPEPVLERRDRVAAPPTSLAETLVLDAFARTLARNDLGIDDDFFDLGGNSIKAVAVVAALASDFRITANDLFRLRTARAIAREIPMRRGDLHGRLIALVDELREPAVDPLDSLAPDLAAYRRRYKPYAGLSVHQRMSYRDVLLTGATGFLGAYLLRDLLVHSDAKVHVAVRAPSRQLAWQRLAVKMATYFGPELLERQGKRVRILPGDLTDPQLGLERGTYDAVARTIDCAIHAAALTKHYGDSATFVKANVDATKHVLALAKRAGCDVNVISTISVGAGDIPGKAHALFTEFDCDIGQVAGNHYVRTKLLAEKAVQELRDQGLACNIFRVGFLTGDSQTLRFQDNADDSGFVQTLKSYMALGKIPEAALAQSFCPVNEVSDAVLRLMGASSLLNQTHHIDRVIEPEAVTRILAAGTVEPLAEAAFFEWLAANLGDPKIGPAATAMLLHEGLLDRDGTTATVTLREKSDRLLERAGFVWSPVRAEQIWSLTKSS